MPPRRPDDGPESPVPPNQRTGRDRRDRPDPERASHESSAGGWGHLPPVEQELLFNPDTDDLPVRYRRWIEEYFRRVQRTNR